MSSAATHEARTEPATPARRSTAGAPEATTTAAEPAIRVRTSGTVPVGVLQRSAGNAAVSRLLARPSAARPASASPGVVTASTGQDVAPGASVAAVGGEASLGDAVVQRDGEEDSGLFASVRRRLSGIADGIRSGYSTVRDGVGEVVGSLRARGADAVQLIRSAGAGVSDFVQSAIASLPASAAAAFNAARSTVMAPIMAIAAGAGRVRDAVLRLDADALAGAWASVTGLASGAWSAAQAMAGAVGRMLGGLWDGAAGGFRRVLDTARSGATRAVDGIVGLASAATSRLGALWTRVAGFGSDLISADSWGGAIVRRVGGALLAGAERAWSAASAGWQRARDMAGSVGSAVASTARRAWDSVSGAASSAWDAAGRTWTRVRTGMSSAADRITGGVGAFVRRVRSFSITSVVAKLRKHAAAMTGLRTAVADPMSTIEPYASGIADTLSAGMPAAAAEAASPHVAAASSGGRAAEPAGPAAPVQRQVDTAAPAVERTVSGGAEVWAGLGAAFSEKWAKLDVKKMALDALVSIVWPWPKIGEEIVGIGTDMSKAWGNLFMPRNLFEDPAGFFHDLWSDLMKVLDFPIILWRRLNNIALLLLGPITIVLTVIGFIGGSLAGTVLGGIAGALAGLGIGAAPGAGAGFGVGGVGGAGLGFGVAMAVGQAFLISFAAGEVAALAKVLIDLFTTRQTRQEKADDYNTAADSSLALGITALLVGLGWIGGRIASACMAVLRRFVPASVLAVIDEFAAGVRAARKGGLPTEDRPPPPDERPPAPTEEAPRVVDPVVPDMRVPGPQTLTAAELAELQAIANKHQTRLQVTGSRGRGMGRGVETDLPPGKGPGTKSDIDVVIDGQVDINTRGGLSGDVSGSCKGAANVASSIGEAHGPHIDILPEPVGGPGGSERPTLPPSERPTVPPVQRSALAGVGASP